MGPESVVTQEAQHQGQAVPHSVGWAAGCKQVGSKPSTLLGARSKGPIQPCGSSQLLLREAALVGKRSLWTSQGRCFPAGSPCGMATAVDGGFRGSRQSGIHGSSGLEYFEQKGPAKMRRLQRMPAVLEFSGQC